jgi:hypothetical protein
MAPQKKGTIPTAQLDRLLRAQALSKEAQKLYELSMAQALEAGGSIREVGEVTGASTTTVQKYGHANGWPSPSRRAELDAGKMATDEFAARLATAELLMRELGML